MGGVLDPAAAELRLPHWAYALRPAAHGGEIARGKRVPVTAAAASLGHDPAIFLRTYAHLYPGTSEPWPTPWTWLARRYCRPNAKRPPMRSQAWRRADFVGMARRRRQESQRKGS